MLEHSNIFNVKLDLEEQRKMSSTRLTYQNKNIYTLLENDVCSDTNNRPNKIQPNKNDYNPMQSKFNGEAPQPSDQEDYWYIRGTTKGGRYIKRPVPLQALIDDARL